VPNLTIAQDPAADELLGRDPLAPRLGMLLDQYMRRRSVAPDADHTVSRSRASVVGPLGR